MEFDIVPHEGVGSIKFNMSRDEVRKRIEGTFRSFTRWQDDEPLSDYYHDLGVFCYYDADDRLEAMEFAPPARPAVAGVEFLGLSFSAAFDRLCLLDSTAEKDSDGGVAPKLGVGIWSSAPDKDPDEPLETVIAFRPGYYD